MTHTRSDCVYDTVPNAGHLIQTCFASTLCWSVPSLSLSCRRNTRGPWLANSSRLFCVPCFVCLELCARAVACESTHEVSRAPLSLSLCRAENWDGPSLSHMWCPAGKYSYACWLSFPEAKFQSLCAAVCLYVCRRGSRLWKLVIGHKGAIRWHLRHTARCPVRMAWLAQVTSQ